MLSSQFCTIFTISIHASRGGSDPVDAVFFNRHLISIHASRGGSDKHLEETGAKDETISIHASRGGSDKIAHTARRG